MQHLSGCNCQKCSGYGMDGSQVYHSSAFVECDGEYVAVSAVGVLLTSNGWMLQYEHTHDELTIRQIPVSVWNNLPTEYPLDESSVEYLKAFPIRAFLTRKSGYTMDFSAFKIYLAPRSFYYCIPFGIMMVSADSLDGLVQQYNKALDTNDPVASARVEAET